MIDEIVVTDQDNWCKKVTERQLLLLLLLVVALMMDVSVYEVIQKTERSWV
jgi:hypothetical protein